MTPEKLALDTLNDVLASVPPEEQLEIEAVAAALRRQIEQHGNAGKIALALLWAELAAE